MIFTINKELHKVIKIYSLDLRNFGEPLMDRRLADFAKHARQSGFSKIYIHTNGHPLTQKRLDDWGRMCSQMI
jgi:uncharacterized radical SAM superfamily Fe-S cluster-containing enzyme